jgi:aldose 1-epimerase
MGATLRLAAGPLSAEVIPAMGGGVARFDFTHEGAVTEIFRGCPRQCPRDPNELGLYVLAPWSNRISGGGFRFGGLFHPLTTNVAGEPFPIHGDAWQALWSVEAHEIGRVLLGRDSQGPGPFRYQAALAYELSPDRLSVRLTMTNSGDAALPFGGGFHPWLPRTARTRLIAPARSVWLEDERHLPTQNVPADSRPDWDFDLARPLPDDWINNCFSDWNGRATILWEDRALALDIWASPPIGAYILNSPSADSSFFCFEPVTHAVDAHNLAPGPEAHGLVTLAPGAALVLACQFIVRAGAAGASPP